MPPEVTVVDYGMGNLASVLRAFAACGAEARLAGDPEAIRAADRLVLPGVGAFADGMAELQGRGLAAAIRDFAASGKPLLGICLGMQMMMETSEEFGLHQGLALIRGGVRAVPRQGADGAPHKVPHIGWNRLLPAGPRAWKETILDNLSPDATAYFVHSYAAHPSSSGDLLAECDYDGCRIAAAVRSGSVYGCQFHPEKSGPVGLRILRNFLSLS